MNATQLYNEHGRGLGMWYCEKCRLMGPDRETAEECCKPRLCECGSEVGRGMAMCDKCRTAYRHEKEVKRWEEAKPVRYIDVPAMVYIENHDVFTDEPETWIEECDVPDGEDPPRLSDLRIYACHRVLPETDVCHLLDDALDNAYDDAFDDIPDGADAKLQKMLDEWWKETGIHWWEPDFSRKVVFK